MHFRKFFLALLPALLPVVLLFPAALRAQAPAGSAKLTAGAVADSLSVLEDIDDALKQHASDATLWFRRGMIAWALTERDKYEPKLRSLDKTRLGRLADTSLRIAADIDKNNAYYRLMSARYLLSTETSLSRAASYGIFEKALETARKGTDAYTHSEAAVESGRVYWRRYDGLADRWNETRQDDACEPVTGAIGPAEISRMRALIMDCARPAGDAKEPSGESDYLKAEELFREAYDAQPSNQRAYRQLAMLLVERKRWTELGALAQSRINSAPWDAWAWLTLGLTLHERHADARTIVSAYDSAFAQLSYDEVRWFSTFERVLRPNDTIKYASADPTTRFAMHRLFWTSANPLWSRDAAQPQLDFLSRVVYAELRWTVEELGVRGADSDRGDVYIRYGAPDLVVSRRRGDEPSNPIYTTWLYDRGLVFSFRGLPTFATARIPPEGQQVFADIVKTAPALWTEAPGFKLDSMPVQMARFRARGDSVDVVVAALPPVADIQSGAEIAGAVREDFWLLAGGTIVVARDSVVPAHEGVRRFNARVGAHDYIFRVEASSEGSLHGARASAAFRAANDSVTGFMAHGFSISDLLIATKAAEGRNRPIRWSDLDITPTAGSVVRGTPLSIVWEDYELARNTNGSADYTVTIALQRDTKGPGRITAQVMNRLGSTVGVATGDDRSTISFDRNIPWATTIVENVNLALGDTPAGTYRMIVTVTDKTSGKTTSRSTMLELRAR
ncbi:MAG TPA: GWxTD domain-containing protein [Gemmatimonadaceae bacterium]|nr:GWxTD domain-containing protein [Gemmatimonadaceae bacterium]